MPAVGMYSLSVRTFGRRRKVKDADGGTRIKRCSVVAKIAYQSGEAIYDDYLGCEHDYTRKAPGVIKTGIFGWKGLRSSLLNRAKIWNMVNSAETRKNAKICRSFILALPCQLNRADQWACLEKYSRFVCERYRTIADAALHAPDPGKGHDNRNWHGHIVMPRREVTNEDGYTAKNRSFDVLDKKWLSGAELKILRAEWANILNEMLALRGIDVRVDHRSFEERGIEQIPTIHRGPGGQAQIERDIRPESKTQLDPKGREVDYKKIDEGMTRPEKCGEIVDLNDMRLQHGPIALLTQIANFDAYIDMLMEKCADLEAIIPASMLPTWVRLKVEHYRRKLEDFLARAWQEKEEEEEEQEEKREKTRERVGLHEQMRRMREQIKELEAAKARREALLKFYMKAEAYCAMRPPIERDYLPPPREISNEQFRVELHFKAETARAKVPAEYRPRIERPAESLPESRTGQGGQFTAAARAPPDNGGLAEAPPPMAPTFNAAANPGPEPYKQKVRIGFGVA